jgi:LCP family protein required for cell wall assembly
VQIYDNYQPTYPAHTARHLRAARRRWWRMFCFAGCFIPVLCGSVFMVGYVLFPPAPVDMLILGVDARPGQGYLTRTDSIMLLNVSPGDFDVTLLSIPRDVAIYVPYYGEQRINTINALGEMEGLGQGPTLLKASFAESFDVEVERYVRLDFDGFEALIDAVGGVDIDVPKLIIDYDYPTIEGGTITVRFDPGVQHMDGERALQYARTRHQDDDYQRAGRQQQVVDALVRKLTDPRSVMYWPRVWVALRESTDTDMSAWDWLKLGPAWVLGWRGREERVLQREDLIGMAAGYWRPDYDALLPWIDAHFD